jgi:hypothetical protein
MPSAAEANLKIYPWVLKTAKICKNRIKILYSCGFLKYNNSLADGFRYISVKKEMCNERIL